MTLPGDADTLGTMFRSGVNMTGTTPQSHTSTLGVMRLQNFQVASSVLEMMPDATWKLLKPVLFGRGLKFAGLVWFWFKGCIVHNLQTEPAFLSHS